jgi:tetratricopeptide (TPR) repeat protein
MDGYLERARLLISQSRPKDAESYARKSIEEDGESPEAFHILTQANIQLDQSKEAVTAAGEGLRLDPDSYLSHFMMGWALLANRDLKKAELHFLQAREIYPDDADVYGFLAIIQNRKSNWDNGLKMAEHGLSLDSENITCVNARAQALLHTKRGEEARDTLESALGRAPENASLHFNRGYTQLEKGDFDGAIQSFGEVLRLDPEFEEAKAGLVEALKGRYKIYALFLKYTFFMARLSSGKRYGVFIGGYIVQRFASQSLYSAGYPLLGGLVVGLYLCLILFTWGASSFFNALLFLHPIGRHALDAREKRIAIAVNINLLAGILIIIAGLAKGSLELAAPALGFFGCIIPYSSLSELQTKWKIMVVGLFSAAVNIASLSAIVLALTGMLDEAITVSLFAFVACMLYSWVPGFLADK